jgi:hypothetical protein
MAETTTFFPQKQRFGTISTMLPCLLMDETPTFFPKNNNKKKIRNKIINILHLKPRVTIPIIPSKNNSNASEGCNFLANL